MLVFDLWPLGEGWAVAFAALAMFRHVDVFVAACCEEHGSYKEYDGCMVSFPHIGLT